jgi:hypothetical protein
MILSLKNSKRNMGYAKRKRKGIKIHAKEHEEKNQC